ncbi:MAG: hypothetical protein R3C59_04000 [Planctomycetaceae bacterium]
MQDVNPYAVSQHCRGDADVCFEGEPATSFRIIDDLLICGRRVELPKICLDTGVTDDLVQVEQKTQFPSFKLVIVQRECKVVFWRTRQLQRRRVLQNAAWSSVAVLGIAGLLVTAQLSETVQAITGLTGFLAIGIGLTGLTANSLRLSLVRFQAPNTYWIRGFPKVGLARISAWQQAESTSTHNRTSAQSRTR